MSLKSDFPQISVIFSISRKNMWNVKILFPVSKKLVLTSRNERLTEKCVPFKEKIAFTGTGFRLLFGKIDETVFH